MHERNLCSQGTVLPEPGCETFLSHAHKTRFHLSVLLRSHLRHARATKAFRFPPMAAMANKSTSGAIAKGTRNSSPEELDEDDSLTEPALDDIDLPLPLSILNY